MKPDMNNSNTSSLDDATAMQLFMANAIAANNTAQEEKEKLNEMILDATSSKTQAVPVDHANIENVTKTRDKLVALRSNASVEAAPVLDKAIQLVNAHLADPKSITPTETKSSEPSIQSRQKQMSVAFATQSEMLVKKSSAPALAATSNSGSSLGALPAPVLPPSNCPLLPTDGGGSDWNQTDANGSVYTLVNYLANNPTDPTAQMELMNFLATATPAQVTQITQWLNQTVNVNGVEQPTFQMTGDNGLIAMWASTMAKYAFFTGYNGNNGATGMNSFLNDILAKLNNPQNQFAADMQTYLTQFQNGTGIYAVYPPGSPPVAGAPSGNGAARFIFDHTDASGNLIWVSDNEESASYPGSTYYWTNSGTYSVTDQDMIEAMINGGYTHTESESGIITGGVNPWFATINLKAMDQLYRVSTLDQIVKEFGGDNLMYAITLWLATDFSTENGAQIEGQNVQIGLLTQGSPFGNDMTDAISAFANGTGTDTDAANLVRSLTAQRVFLESHPELASMLPQFTTGVLDQVMGLSVNVPGTTPVATVTLDTLVAAYSQGGNGAVGKLGFTGGMTQALGLMFGAGGSIAIPPAGTMPNPGAVIPNANAQIGENAATQDTALFSGLSKTASTTLATITSFSKTIEQFAEKIISMQKTNEKYIANYITN